MNKLIVLASCLGTLALALGSLTAASASIGAWDEPATLAISNVDGYPPQLVTDGTTVTAAWEHFDGAHYVIQVAHSFDGGSTWGTVATLSDIAADSHRPHLVTDGTNITVVWSRVFPGWSVIQAASSVDQGATWSSPTSVSVAGPDSGSPQIVSDGTTITVAWTAYINQYTGYQVQSSVSSDGGATWSVPTTISNGLDALLSHLATDGTTVIVMWSRLESSFHRVQAASSGDDGATWSSPATLSAGEQDAWDAQVIIDGADALATWTRFDGSDFRVQSASSTDYGITWSDPINLSSVGQDAIRPQLVTDGTNVTAAWERSDGTKTRIQVARSVDGGLTWSNPANLSAAGQDAEYPQVVADGGTIVAAWKRFDGTRSRVQVTYSVDGGVTWNSPTTVSIAGQDAGSPELATDGTTMTVGWEGSQAGVYELQVASITPTTRIAGSDRYSTSAAVAQQFETADTVYLANGRNYPDALSAAPAAAHANGPLLLTEQGSLPAVIAAEIVRLDPSEIVIVGGFGVVSQAVEDTLKALQPDSHVSRLAGADRYETSRLVTAGAFTTTGANTAFIATGTNFPDALSASAAAAHYAGPVILVNGSATNIDTATLDLLETLNTTKVVLAGGTGVISDGIESGLQALLGDPNVRRLAGANRYATSVAINIDTFVTSNTVYLAVGTGYADALSGAALAGSKDAPLFIVPSTCVPQAVLDTINALGATKVVLLGGVGVLNSSVAALAKCA